MRSHDSSQDSSLELLLDTICNTFGGVLFISLLVVILLNMTSKEVALEPASEASETELVELQQELTETNREMNQLQGALQTQQRTEAQILDPELEELVQDLKVNQQSCDAMIDAKNTHLEQTGQSQIEINKIARELRELDNAMARAEVSLAAAKRQREKEVEDRTRNSELPTPSRTEKSQVPVFLKAGRLCFYAKCNSAGDLVPNPAEVKEVRDGGGVFIEPKPNTGIQVSLTGDNDSAIEDRLGEFDKDRYYLSIFVWPDSFEHFSMVRNIVLHKGFDYGLNPFPEDGKVRVGNTPTEEEVFR
jgi:hypothetical protein